jgi:hypothetical protein
LSQTHDKCGLDFPFEVAHAFLDGIDAHSVSLSLWTARKQMGHEVLSKIAGKLHG